MSKLYIANTSRQVQEIQYRLDFSEQGVRVPFQPATRQKIEPGHQVLVAGKDLHVSQVETVVKQLSRYGMAGVAEVPRLRRKVFQVFNVDKPVPHSVIRNVMDMNQGYLTDEGRDRRKAAAVATNEIIAHAVTNDFAAHGIPKDPMQTVDVEFEQLEQSEAGESRVEEGYRVRDIAPGEPSPKSRRMKRAA